MEQSHYRFQQAVDQALRVRGSRDFVDRASYEHFLHELVRYRNQTRAVRYAQEQQALRPLPTQPLAPCRELQVSVSRFSTITVQSIMRDKSVPVNPVNSNDFDQASTAHVSSGIICDVTIETGKEPI